MGLWKFWLNPDCYLAAGLNKYVMFRWGEIVMSKQRANLDKEEGCLSLDAGFLAKTSAGISNNNGDHK